MYGTKTAAAAVYEAMQNRGYSTAVWSQHELHPKAGEGLSDVDVVNFIFTMDLLNFSFWSALPETERYQVEYRGKRWTGYNSLVACLQRALEEDIHITTPRFWRSGHATDHELKHVFRSATAEQMHMLDQRLAVMREAADILYESFSDVDNDAAGDEDETHDDITQEDAKQSNGPTDSGERIQSTVDRTLQSEVPVCNVVCEEHGEVQDDGDEATVEQDETASEPLPLTEGNLSAKKTSPPEVASAQSERQADSACKLKSPPRPDYSVIRLIETAEKSAGKLVSLLAKQFACFRDETHYDGRRVRFLKRAQIFVADLWAAFNGSGFGEFHDIDALTMFPDYRVPQMLYTLGVLSYSPPLEYHIRDLKDLPPGHPWEVQLRGCSIWAVELIRREIVKNHPEAEVNAVLIDFFLYDLAKEREVLLQGGLAIPHHRTRSIWY